MQDGKRKVAKWEHVIKFYQLDTKDDDVRKMCPRLTEEHVLPNKLKKMKVKCCTQVFSHRVSSAMWKMAQWSSKYFYFFQYVICICLCM